MNRRPHAADYSKIPTELKALANWVCYRLETRKGDPQPTKVPYHPSGSKANTTTQAPFVEF